jgi:uncharacterized protein (TIGR04255 family)
MHIASTVGWELSGPPRARDDTQAADGYTFVQGTATVIPESYENPPIVEAVVEIRVAPSTPWTENLHRQVVERLRPLYGGPPTRQNQLVFQANSNAQGSEVTAASEVIFHKEMLPTADGRAVVGVGNSLISVHVLAPYPGWKSFLPRVQEAVAAYWGVMKPHGASLVSVRYIDKILIPREENVDLHKYFTSIPGRPESMPGMLEAFHFVTQSRDAEPNCVALLTVASQPPTSQHFPILYDLALTRQFAVPVAIEEVQAHADFLHGRQRGIFEESITDSTRELFS